MGFFDMFFGGSETKETTIPPYIEDAMKEAIGRSQAASRIGYTPYYGADVAAFTPDQTASFANTNRMAGLLGMQGGSAPSMPQAQNFGGVMGYSSGNLYDEAVAELARRRPGQKAAIDAQFIDPVTGAMSKYDQGLIADKLTQAGLDPTTASNVASGNYDASTTNALEQIGLTGEQIMKMRALGDNPLMALIPGGGLLGLLSNYAADYYAGDYGKEGQPGLYADDTYYRSNGVPTPVRGSSFYNSSEAASNRGSVAGGDYVTSTGGNASRGFTYGGW